MKTFQASNAKTRFLRILDDVERGESVTITRRGRTIAEIRPKTDSDPNDLAAAVMEMRKLRERIGTLTLEEILSARDEGRA
jgi:prevent-host-death family protein